MVLTALKFSLKTILKTTWNTIVKLLTGYTLITKTECPLAEVGADLIICLTVSTYKINTVNRASPPIENKANPKALKAENKRKNCIKIYKKKIKIFREIMFKIIFPLNNFFYFIL